MKEKTKMFGTMRSIVIIAFVAVIGFSMAACPSGGGSKILKAVDNDLNAYELNIGSGEVGDDYVLIITTSGGSTKTSTGKIDTITGNMYTLKHSGGTTFTVSISGDSLTGIAGSIPIDEGGTYSGPGASVSPITDGGDGSLNGKWSLSGQTVTFNGRDFSYTVGGETYKGTASYGSGNSGILVTQGSYGGGWVVAGRYTLTPGVKIDFSDFTGLLYGYSGAWIKQ